MKFLILLLFTLLGINAVLCSIGELDMLNQFVNFEEIDEMRKKPGMTDELISEYYSKAIEFVINYDTSKNNITSLDEIYSLHEDYADYLLSEIESINNYESLSKRDSCGFLEGIVCVGSYGAFAVACSTLGGAIAVGTAGLGTGLGVGYIVACLSSMGVQIGSCVNCLSKMV